MDNGSSCCQGESGCCSSKPQKKEIAIDFLFLDLNICERCKGTESNLDAAISDVSVVLKAAGFHITVNKVNIISKDLAVKYKFLSSPTIRINGSDIAMQVIESSCKDCGDLCGDDVDCRVWTYEGTEYTQPPKEYIINAILKEVYTDNGQNKVSALTKEEYELPDNLKKFFEALENK